MNNIETPRFLLRKAQLTDAPDFFALDSDPAVLRYIGLSPVQQLEESIAYIESLLREYREDGMARWVIIDKKDGAFVGWSGLRYETEILAEPYYDIGYRLLPKYWGQGIATETASAALRYGFSELKLPKIIGLAHVENIGSNRVLRKIGLQYDGIYHYSEFDCHQYSLSQQAWERANL